MTSSLHLQVLAELELRKRQHSGIRPLYDRFKTRYWDDPVGFIHDCILWPEGKAPYFYQEENLQALVDNDRVCITGPHGLGKTAQVSWAIHWFALTRDGYDWKIPTTASAWRQLQKFLWPEIHKWGNRLRWDVIGRSSYNFRTELLMQNLKLDTGEAFALASDNSEALEGAHADHLLYIFDEAKTISEKTWDAVEGAFSTGNTKWLAVSTPGEPQGRFFSIQSKAPGYEDWHVRRVSTEDCLEAGALKQSWVDSRRRQWGETSAVFLNRVRGLFAESSKDGVIPLSWVELAIERWYDWQAHDLRGSFTSLGVDVGGGEEGSDKSTIATIIDGVKVKDLRIITVGDPHVSTMELVGRVSGILNAYAIPMRVPSNSLLAVIDALGIGLGTLQRLKEQGFNAQSFSAGKSTNLKDKSGELGFVNWRSCGWFLLREMLEPKSGFNVCLPPDSDDLEDRTNLVGDLTAPRWTVTSTGLIQVESKDTIRKRIHRSTDAADAVIHGIIGPVLLEEEVSLGKTEYRVY